MQQHGNICLARLHTLDPGDGVKKSKYFFLFLREFCCISSLREQSIGQHLSKTYVLTHTLKLVKMVKTI